MSKIFRDKISTQQFEHLFLSFDKVILIAQKFLNQAKIEIIEM